MESWDEAEWRSRVDAALGRIRTILDNTRNPRYAADVPHRYDDKYLLAEFLARVSMASLLSCLESIGLAPEGQAKVREWAHTRAVSLRFTAREDCKFLREEIRKVESTHQIVTERTFLGSKSERTEKIVTNVTEYFWAFDFEYAIVAFQGA